MSDATMVEQLRRRYDELLAALDAAAAGRATGDRDQLRDGIVGLFRETDAAIGELTSLKESIRPLVDRYRELFPSAGRAGAGDQARPAESAAAPLESAQPGEGTSRSAPQSSAAASTIHIDHLGSSTYLERGWNGIAAASYGAAVEDLQKALSLAPGHTRAEALLGWALMRDGRISDARAVLEALLARDPDNHLARANLGFVEMRQGRFAEAIEHLASVTRAAEDRTASLYAHLYLGMVYAEREMYRDAEIFLTRALEIGPNLIEAYWELGRVRYRAGDLKAAGAAWRQGAETNPFNPWGERCGEAADRVAAGEAVSFG